ncbi:MAG: hypothetical protein PHS62_00700 [Patescibacteria group bacterium]|nr:hypothetical protein [Patescibacteria group bacterium]
MPLDDSQPAPSGNQATKPANNQTAPPNSEVQSKAAAPAVKKISGKRIIIWTIIILLVALALYFLFKFFLSPKADDYGAAVDVNQQAKTIETSKDLGPETAAPAIIQRAQAVASSENFDLMQISLEGSGTNVFDFEENNILELSDVASELYTVKQGEGNEIRAVISCRTNKRAYVEVEYLQSGEKDKKTVKDDYFGFGHTVVLPELNPDSVYKYSIRATDTSQAVVYSEQFVFYTGAGNISLVDILENAVQKVFGWAVGK